MNERSVDDQFFQIVKDEQLEIPPEMEYNAALGIWRDYQPMKAKTERLQEVLEASLVKYGPYEGYTDEEKIAILAVMNRYLEHELQHDKEQLQEGDEIIASGDAFVLCADESGDESKIEMLGKRVRLHGLVNQFSILPVPVFMDSADFFEPDFEPLDQLSVVLDIAQPALELTSKTPNGIETYFHDLSHHDHVLLPLVYTKDGLEIKRRVIET